MSDDSLEQPSPLRSVPSVTTGGVGDVVMSTIEGCQHHFPYSLHCPECFIILLLREGLAQYKKGTP
jgi:hypothetical protein